jgi:hypothetical protein
MIALYLQCSHSHGILTYIFLYEDYIRIYKKEEKKTSLIL